MGVDVVSDLTHRWEPIPGTEKIHEAGGPFELATEDVLGVPTLVFKNRHPNLRASLGSTAARLPDAPHLVFPDRGIELTFSDVVASAARIAAVLAERRRRQGRRRGLRRRQRARLHRRLVGHRVLGCRGVEPQRLVDARTSSPTASS